MIRSFRNVGTEDLFNGVDSKAARRVCPTDLVTVARRKLGYLDAAATLADLRRPPHNRLEKLAGDRQGQHAIRVNDQYRICFLWRDDAAEAAEIVDYH